MFDNKNVMPTFLGFGMDLSKDPSESTINILDIVWALSHQCRFAGHTTQFYSVAEHSVRVSLICPPQFALEGLMHDATEAYLQDIIRPLRVQLDSQGYLDLEKKWARHIGRQFGILDMSVLSPEVIRADLVMLATECRDLINTPDIVEVDLNHEPVEQTIAPWDPPTARTAFMKRLGEIAPQFMPPMPGHA